MIFSLTASLQNDFVSLDCAKKFSFRRFYSLSLSRRLKLVCRVVMQQVIRESHHKKIFVNELGNKNRLWKIQKFY